MIKKVSFSIVMLAALLLSACAPAATPAPTSAATSASSGASTSATPVATIPTDLLTRAGHLQICSDIPYPPQEFYDENGNPQGLDIDIGNEIAARLGLQPEWINSVFDTIIAAVTSGKCDIIISAQNITPDRQKQVSMIPYFEAGQTFVVQKGNPHNVKDQMDLCGHPAAAESGTTEADYLQGVNTYDGVGLAQKCQEAGLEPPTVVVAQKDTDALQQLLSDKVWVYSTDSPVAAYYTVQQPDKFEIVHQVLEPAVEGISVPCGEADCTNAPLTPVGEAVQTALHSMMNDGTYKQILDKWNLGDSAVQP